MAANPPLFDAPNLGEAIGRTVDEGRAGRLFMVCNKDGGGQRELKRGELGGRIRRFGGLCRARDIEPASRVLVCSRDDEHIVTLVAACLAHGMSAVIVDPDSSANEVRGLLERVEPRAAVVDRTLTESWDLGSVPDLIRISKNEPGGSPLLRKLLGRKTTDEAPSHFFPGVLDSYDLIDVATDIDDGDEAYVLLTSGSTGGSKAVSISRRSLFAHAQTLARHLGYDRETRLMSALPLSHTDGLIHGCLVPWLVGATTVRAIPFEMTRIGELLDAVYTYRATHLLVVPTMLALFDRYGDDYREAFVTEDFRCVISSAEHLSEPLWRRFQERFSVPVANIYGLTESVVGGLFCGPDDTTFKLGTIGRPVDCRARIVDDAGHVLSSNEPGELQLCGELLMSGYVGDAEATRKVLVNGWFDTGDIAVEDDEGFFSIVGRTKNLVISGGRNVHPEEVREVLLRCDGVAEAVAFGIGDETFGEAVAACVVLDDEAQISTEDLRAFCREFLAPFKCPRVIVRLPSLPRGSTGKVDVNGCRRLLERPTDNDAPALGGGLRSKVLHAASATFAIPADRLGPESRPDTTPGWDSFAHLALIVALEETFDMRFSTGEILEIGSLGDAEAVVRRRLAEILDK